METLGQDILKGLRDTRQFFEQISLLVRTSEDILGEKGWINALENSTKTCDISSGLYQPQKWMPRMIARFYINEEANDFIVYIVVLLDPEPSWGGFEEPWLTAGLFQYLPEKNPRNKIALDWIGAELLKEQNPDGQFTQYRWKQEDIDSGYSQDVVFQSIMALPLVELKNAEDLKNKITNPLLEELDMITKRPK